MDYKLNVGLGLILGYKKPKSKILVLTLFSCTIYKINILKQKPP